MAAVRSYYFIALALIISVPTFAADIYQVGNNDKTDTVKFESQAKLEFLDGQTTDITGHFSIPEDLSADSIRGILQVDLRTLETGIETRDGHMRDNHLHTEKYPFAYFELIKLTNDIVKIIPDSLYTVSGLGYFYIHGVKRELVSDIAFRLSDDRSIVSVTARFEIELDNFKIPRPKALFLKLAKVIDVNVKFEGSVSSEIEPIILPDYELLQ